MIREIRFRGKRLDNGAWENGRFVVNFGAGDVFEIGECFNKTLRSLVDWQHPR